MVTLIEQDYEKNKKLYNKIEKELRKRICKDIPLSHIGSTAIPDMIGKNIIDILVGADSQSQFEELSKILGEVGYFSSKNSRNEIYQFFASKEGETGSGDIHIHLVMLGTVRYNEFLILRDYLLNNKAEVLEYTNYKRDILYNKTAERQEYRTIKSEYVTKLLERAKKGCSHNERMRKGNR